jgi:3-oxoacyl-[acyl-carrier-protein] synthase-1
MVLPTASRSELTVVDYSTCNALGMSNSEVLRSLREGVCALRPHPDFEGTVCGAVPESPPPLMSRLSEYDTRVNRLAAAALEPLQPTIRRTIRRWGADRVALVFGSSTAGIDTTEKAYTAFKHTGSLPLGYSFERKHSYSNLIYVMRYLSGIRGPGYVVSTACSAAAKAFCSAGRLIFAGFADAVLLGGVDALCQITVRGFRSLNILSNSPCRPFSTERNGMNIGEGAAIFVLEREGEGPARFLGSGESSDAYRFSTPAPDGRGIITAMQGALHRSGLAPNDIDHINAHATGTRLNDAAEGRAIAELFPPSVRVVATKGYTGHTLGAAGAIEAALSVMAIEHGWIPASLGAEPLDPELPLRVTLRSEPVPSRFVLSNSFAFGGSNACIALGRTV